MDLHLKPPQNLNYKSMCRQTKSSSKKSLKHNQLAFRLRDIFSPWSPPNFVSKITQPLHLQYVAQVNPRGPKLDRMPGLQVYNRR
jgi:hypothetical protein